MFLAITESKKIVIGEGSEPQVNFEKHKIFLYKEDFEKFVNGLQEAIRYIEQEQGSIAGETRIADCVELSGKAPASDANEIKIDIDF